MSAQAMTLVSGIILLIILVLVGWNLRRTHHRSKEERNGKQG